MKTALRVALLFMALLLSLSPRSSAMHTRDWGERIPAEIAASALESDRVLDETPCEWRPLLAPIFCPLVEDCTSAREAALRIAANIGELTGVYYSRERRKPSMNACEALEQKKVSCTGQSILLVCALRCVGIPARAVGVATWNHVPGNHTWVEVWLEGQWMMLEFNEKGFNTPWVMEAIGMLNPAQPNQRILAAQPGGVFRFPTPWDAADHIAAEDVSERYHTLARQWYSRNGVPAGHQKLMVDAQPREKTPRLVLLEDASGRELGRATLPTPQDDMRQFASLLLPRDKPCYLRVEGTAQRHPLRASNSAVQFFCIQPQP